MSKTLDLSKALIERKSVTPEDNGCQNLMINRLEKIGFKIEKFRFQNVNNFWARRGKSRPLFTFAGHTDVVPAGSVSDWVSPPFKADIRDGFLYGRGAADMKGSLAAMITATEDFINKYPNHHGSIGYLITSDEEGPSINGTVKVIRILEKRNEKIDWCLIGEPSSNIDIGDTIKNGRRGSHNAKLVVYGKQGHIAYPHLACNPIHLVVPAIKELIEMKWDQGNNFFPPTNLQISNINGGTGVTNVIPGNITMLINLRFSTEITFEIIEERVASILDHHNLNYNIEWNLSGKPFLTKEGQLIYAVRKAINEVVAFETTLSTSGGISDGRFIAPTGAQVIELGPINKTIHQVNECIRVEDLNKLNKIYQHVLKELLT